MLDTPRRIGIIGETSGRVRDACLARGHDAISCDILPSDTPGPHRQGDARDFDWTGFDLIVCHPPCTYLCNSGVRWLHTEPGRREKMVEGAEFFRWCLGLPCRKIGVENPVMHRYAREIIGRGPDFTVQPWQFGDDFKKRTCFWTVGLPPLRPTSNLDGSTAVAAGHEASPGPNRWKVRSVTYAGIAAAIADQWVNHAA